MSMETNKGVVMRCKTIPANLLTVVGLIVEPITAIENTKGYIEAFISIRQNPLTLKSSNQVILPSLSIFFSFRSMLRFNIRSHRVIDY